MTGTVDPFHDDPSDLLDVGWKSEADLVEEILGRFCDESFHPEMVDQVRQELDQEGIPYLRVIGEYDSDQGCGVIRVVLEDGTEVSIP